MQTIKALTKGLLASRAGSTLGRAAAAAAIGFGGVQAAYAVNDLPGGPAVRQTGWDTPVTAIAADIAWLHTVMLVICTVIFVAVFGVMFYSIIKHRKSVGHKSANFHESVTVEIAWTVVPFLIVIVMGALATKAVVAQKDTTNADITVKATGYQWRWSYDYLNGEGAGIKFLSTLDNGQRVMSDMGKADGDDYLLKVDNPLVVPVNKKVRVITTAGDVIHAWYVPALGVQLDAVPGFVRDTWFRADKVGDYYGQCAKLCGKEHSYMPIHVKVLSDADYASWVAGKQKEMAAKADDPAKVWALDELIARGEKVYTANCQACHQANGKGGGPVKALDGSPTVLDADKGRQIAVLLHGQNNGAMPSWKQLSDTEIAAVITYTKNSWSNKTGFIVQPSDVVAARNQ